LSILGIHHVTAICSDAQANVDFYAGTLGLRLVKVTVNFDDPQSYHLYYGDYNASPGTLMTFFVWPGGRRGRIGPPQATQTAFSVPVDSIDFWQKRLTDAGVACEEAGVRFGDPFIRFSDPDGMGLEIVGNADSRQAWKSETVPIEHAIRGFDSVTLRVRGAQKTRDVLSRVMGATSTTENDRTRFAFGNGASGHRVDVIDSGSDGAGNQGAGIVHHVAFRVADDASQAEWLKKITGEGLHVSPVMERNYFRSIYYREPGGVLFEIATDPPGMAVDEPLESLGTTLKLPAPYEPHREEIRAILPKIKLPSGVELP
jgi:glyoxalase family protein